MTKPRRRATSDTGPVERHQHGDVIELHDADDAGIKRSYVVTQTPLARYHVRGLLGAPMLADRRLEAGNGLYGLFYRAGLSNRTTGGYQVKIGGGSVEGYRVLCIDAYNEYMAARDKIRSGCVDVVYDVVCQHLPAKSHAGLECLKLGLDDVAWHFRLG